MYELEHVAASNVANNLFVFRSVQEIINRKLACANGGEKWSRIGRKSYAIVGTSKEDSRSWMQV